MNIHNKQRTIYLARAGEALIEHLYKADADLSSLGWEYADKLCEALEDRRNKLAQKSIEKADSGTLTPGGHEPGSGPGEAGRPLEVSLKCWLNAKTNNLADIGHSDMDLSTKAILSYCTTFCRSRI